MEDAILQTMRKIEDRLSDIDRDMEKDRHNLQDLNIRLSGVESQLEELRKAINQNSERTKNKVADAITPILESTDRLTTQIEKKKMVILKQETQSIFTKLFGFLWKKNA